ncbi:eEF1delta [Drosophila busckii]|uniref:EEF1delta n=1 Tax=Drosophila busckii TaxID=30019 RepID=A0A0M5IWH2_DROBS|nr:probable elongation factor 1-delta isoform X2 [Drosophila busckii]ALC39206.1 eEF1delta [Drosophila busckii]
MDFEDISIDTNKVSTSNNCSILVSEIAKAREHIQSSLEKIDGSTFEASSTSDILKRITSLENENKDLKQAVEKYAQLYNSIVRRIEQLENTKGSNKDEIDSDIDLFGSESEEESADQIRIREERLAKYSEKKANKAAIIAKSNVILDVKPWDDEVNLQIMEAKIRTIKLDGLLWGASKLLPVAFGIQKLTISCVVEDEQVSIDWLIEEIEKIEELVQSVDIASFNKI